MFNEREDWCLDLPLPHHSPLPSHPHLRLPPDQLIINLHVLDVKLEMKAPNLLLAQVEALTKIFGGCLFHDLLKVIWGCVLLSG